MAKFGKTQMKDSFGGIENKFSSTGGLNKSKKTNAVDRSAFEFFQVYQ